MDKETIVRICNRLRDGSLSLEEVSVLLTGYCLEHDKPLDKILLVMPAYEFCSWISVGIFILAAR